MTIRISSTAETENCTNQRLQSICHFADEKVFVTLQKDVAAKLIWRRLHKELLVDRATTDVQYNKQQSFPLCLLVVGVWILDGVCHSHTAKLTTVELELRFTTVSRVEGYFVFCTSIAYDSFRVKI